MPRIRNANEDNSGLAPYAGKYDGRPFSFEPGEVRDVDAVFARFLMDNPRFKRVDDSGRKVRIFELLDLNTKPQDWPRVRFMCERFVDAPWVYKYDGKSMPLKHGQEESFHPDTFKHLQKKIREFNRVYGDTPITLEPASDLPFSEYQIAPKKSVEGKTRLGLFHELRKRAVDKYGLKPPHGSGTLDIQQQMMAANLELALQDFIDLGLQLPPEARGEDEAVENPDEGPIEDLDEVAADNALQTQP